MVADAMRQYEGGVPEVAASSEPSAEDVVGSFDDIHAGAATGWVAVSGSNVPREVEILANGEVVAFGTADKLREDLVSAGIGSGRHAFRVILPTQLYNGIEYNLVARDRATGVQLHGSPKRYRADVAERGELVLDGGSLAGWARVAGLAVDQVRNLPIQVLDGTEVIADAASAVEGGAPCTIKFRIPLPPSVFDGRPHFFSVRAKDSSLLLGELATIVPYKLTPEDAVREYARNGLTAALSPAAHYRYGGLLSSLDALAKRSGAGADELRGLLSIHQALVQGASPSDRDYPTLRFPAESEPKVSIVIPVHNKFHVTYHCLASLLLAKNSASFEVILVDDGSSDLTIDASSIVKNVKIVRNEEALGFVHACNRGARSARGQYVVMLNNDTEVTPRWLDELLWAFETFDRVGMAGAKLIYPDGRLQEAGGIVWSSGDPWNYGRLANPHDPRFNYARQVDYLSGACVMLPRPLWEEIGGFDEAYAPAYFEDTDLAFQVRDRGFKTVYVPFSKVIHYEGVSNGKDVSSGLKRFQEINRPKFKNRWARACRGHGKLGVDVELNKDRKVEFRALVLDAETPMPDQAAGAYAAVQEIRMLQALGFKCTFVPQNMAWMAHYTRALQRMGVECIYAPFAASIGEVLERRGREFDVVYITRYYVAQHFIELIRKHAPQAKIVMNNADLHFLRELRAGLAENSGELLDRAAATREIELATMRRVDLVLSYTDVEKAVIQSHNLADTKVARCPWVVDIPDNGPGWEERTDIAFLGGFAHWPNVQGVDWFVREVMPLLREAIPGVGFRVYGSKMPAEFRARLEGEADVFAEGWVPEVRTVYESCRVFVAPLLSGAGIKGKVIGALAHGVPTVMSPTAAEGIPVTDGLSAHIADEPIGWVEAIRRLYEEKRHWESVAAAARGVAERNYGFSRAVLQMRDALRNVDVFAEPSDSSLVAHRF